MLFQIVKKTSVYSRLHLLMMPFPHMSSGRVVSVDFSVKESSTLLTINWMAWYIPHCVIDSVTSFSLNQVLLPNLKKKSTLLAGRVYQLAQMQFT